jgi:hypothetical protein
MAGQWGQWQVHSPANSFNQKQTATNPKTRFFPIDRQWQKPLTPQENLLPKSEIIIQTDLSDAIVPLAKKRK